MAEFWSGQEMYEMILGHPAISENEENYKKL